MEKLKRKDIREKLRSIDYNSKDFEFSFVNAIDDCISNHIFELDENFLFCGRKKFLYNEFFDYLDNKENHKDENPIRFAIINLEEFISDNNFVFLQDVGAFKDENNFTELRDKNDKYSASGYISLQEKEYIVAMLDRLKKELFNSDKFTYQEGEIKIVNCICELCSHFNNGKRSIECPTNLLDKIKNNEIRCPVFDEENSFENMIKKLDSNDN